ncbi:monocyte to macrophage differentiation factor 2 [Uranotaenia lowii]|uniref:monocyte to macrophage differentiation factor 2 n=1 Tax=Uranotaenia lowii TaxID=190385 RepID=UPI00247959D8|nr:monocyte to macrophage differentiation factor 2 [Uranotaenia lowii]
MQDGIISRHHGASSNVAGNGRIGTDNAFSDTTTKSATTGSCWTANGTGASTTQVFHHILGESPPNSAKSSPIRKSSSFSSASHSPVHAVPSSVCNGGAGEFKFCGYDAPCEDFESTSGSGTSPAEIFGVLGFWLKLRHDLTSMPWEQLRTVKMKNSRAAPGCAYIPTEVEHIANVITHGLWVLPSVYGGINLLWRSSSPAQVLAALIYGAALAMLFFVSTFFHCVFYCNRNRPLKDVLHRCDRAMIYIFIAGSYYPWLSLGHTTHPEIVSVIKWCIWVMAILGIIYQQMFHERYKCLETFFYVVIGLGPSIVIILWGHEFTGMSELKFGGLLYIVGIVFFKSDGLFPFAHAIWHMFVVLAAGVHYFAILTYLYPVETIEAT